MERTVHDWGSTMKNGNNVIKVTLIVDQLYSDIKDRIIRGQLKPDEKLSVRQLCEYYGVSDTPVKQALNRLVTEQFVDALPRRGMRVRCITKQEIHEAMEARRMIELFAVPHAIRAAREDRKFLENLERNLAKNEKLLQDIENLRHYSDKAMEELMVSQAFHRMLVNSTENSVIMDSYERIVNHQYVYYQHEKDKSNELIASLNEHRRIYECLKAGDEAATREAIVAHLQIREEDAASVVE